LEILRCGGVSQPKGKSGERKLDDLHDGLPLMLGLYNISEGGSDRRVETTRSSRFHASVRFRSSRR
jgi:hypothetical protein